MLDRHMHQSESPSAFQALPSGPSPLAGPSVLSSLQQQTSVWPPALSGTTHHERDTPATSSSVQHGTLCVQHRVFFPALDLLLLWCKL